MLFIERLSIAAFLCLSPILSWKLNNACTTRCGALRLRGGFFEKDALHLERDLSISNGFLLLSDEVLHDNWRKLISRRVQLPSGRHVNFEIVGQSSKEGRSDAADEAVLVFVWDTKTKTTTLIREYMPSTHKIMHGLAAGMMEEGKHVATIHHDSQRIAAIHELEEECRLIGGTWIRLTENPVTMDKYCKTALTVFLVLDPVKVDSQGAKPRDAAEEGMTIVEGVTVSELQDLLLEAKVTVVGSWACLLAVCKLKEIGEIVDF